MTDDPKPPRKRAAKAATPNVPRETNVVEIRPKSGRNVGARKNSRVTKPENIRVAQRRTRALNMAAAGGSLVQVAEQIRKEFPEFPNYTNKLASADVRHMLDEMKQDALMTYVELQNARLDRWLISIDQAAMTGDVDAIRTGVLIEARRSKLLGLDADRRMNIELSGPGGMPIQIQPVQILDPEQAYDAALRALDGLL